MADVSVPGALDPPPPSPPSLPAQQSPISGGFSFPRPSLRLASYYYGFGHEFFHKVSCHLFDGRAKLRLSFRNGGDGEISSPSLRFSLRDRFRIDYDVQRRNALLEGSFDVGKHLRFHAFHDLKEQRGEVTMTTTLAESSYKLALATYYPIILPTATFQFPTGEVTIEGRVDRNVERVLSMNGIWKSQILNGVCTAQFEDSNLKSTYSDKILKLRCSFKDKDMTFIPEIVLPCNAVSMTFKRRLSPSEKFSCYYQSHSHVWNASHLNHWNTVYKRTFGEELKLEVGYGSLKRAAWASLLVRGKDKAKTNPRKMEVQCMLSLPQDHIRNSFFTFHVKKRWDF